MHNYWFPKVCALGLQNKSFGRMEKMEDVSCASKCIYGKRKQMLTKAWLLCLPTCLASNSLLRTWRVRERKALSQNRAN